MTPTPDRDSWPVTPDTRQCGGLLSWLAPGENEWCGVAWRGVVWPGVFNSLTPT